MCLYRTSNQSLIWRRNTPPFVCRHSHSFASSVTPQNKQRRSRTKTDKRLRRASSLSTQIANDVWVCLAWVMWGSSIYRMDFIASFNCKNKKKTQEQIGPTSFARRVSANSNVNRTESVYLVHSRQCKENNNNFRQYLCTCFIYVNWVANHFTLITGYIV